MSKTKTKEEKVDVGILTQSPKIQRLYDAMEKEKGKLKILRDKRREGLSKIKKWNDAVSQTDALKEVKKKVEVDYDERVNPNLKEDIFNARESYKDAKMSFDIEAITMFVQSKGKKISITKNGKRASISFSTQMRLF